MPSNMLERQCMLKHSSASVNRTDPLDKSEQQFNSPRLRCASRCESPPPAPRRAKPPPLLRALEKNDLAEVRSCLRADPDAATYPFWDHDVEPPLCAAVRLRCDRRIVQTLLENGANPKAEDSIGRSPSQIMAELSSSTPEPQPLIDLFLNVLPSSSSFVAAPGATLTSTATRPGAD